MSIIRFGYEGWRARIGEGFDHDTVSRIADGIGAAFADKYPDSRIYVGYDTRYDARSYAELVASVIAAWGLDVVASDRPCPLPALAWSVAHDDKAAGAVMITASGSPSDYQGMCLRDAKGTIFTDEFESLVESLIPASPSEERASFSVGDLVSAYAEALISDLDTKAIAAADLHVVVDPMFGAGRWLLADLLRQLGVTVDEIHNEDEPDFLGLHPRVEEPWVDACERAVQSFAADAGLVLDGDADRAALIDAQGQLVTHHRMVPLLMGHLVEQRKLSGRVVLPLSASSCLRRQAARFGLETHISPVGFARASQDLARGGALMGVDEFGGISIPEHLLERDGIYCALLLVELLATSGLSVEQLVTNLEREVGSFYYGRRDFRPDFAQVQTFRNLLPGLNPETLAGRTPTEVSHTEGLRLGFEDGSWVVLRPSRTEPVIRVSAEARSPKERDEIIEGARELVRDAH